MQIDFSDGRFWLELLVLALTAVNSAAIWLRKPGRDAQAAVKALQAEFEKDRQQVRLDLQRLEERIAHMPTDEELAELKGDVSSIKARVEGLGDLLRRVEHQGNLIHEHLLRAAQR